MSNIMRDGSAACQDQRASLAIDSAGKSLSPATADEGNDLSLIRTWLREAIDESGWKHDAVAEQIGLTNGAYLSQMLAGEKPIGAKHLRALPDDIERIFAKKYAEHFGLIVVMPLRGEDAIKGLVAGLVGVLAPQLRMARASLPDATVDRRRA